MRFGALTYSTSNLGDEIQTLAALTHLPRVDRFVDRDSLGYVRAEDSEPLAMILNGWFGHGAESWPPAEGIRPLLVSMHLSKCRDGFVAPVSAEEFFLAEPAVDYLRRNGPVGARDLHTLALLESSDVPAYYSGCLTLTLKRTPDAARGDDVVLTDVPVAVHEYVRTLTDRRIVRTTHWDTETPHGSARLEKARALLRLYESAHCVLTTRLHCALPCLALGTPVLLLDAGQIDTRFEALAGLLRVCTLEQLRAFPQAFDIESPAPNSPGYLTLRRSLEETVATFVRQAQEGAAVRAARTETPGELRYQTLARLYAEQAARLQQEARARAQAESDRDAQRNELQALRQQFASFTESAAWRAARLLKRAAPRLPRVARTVKRAVRRFT